MTRGTRFDPRLSAAGLLLVLAVLLALSVRLGSTHAIGDLSTTARGAFAAVGLCDPLQDPALQTIVALRLWRALTAAGVGAALGLSGALVQGLFRNGLASPSVLGVTGGASLGAVIAVLLVGGYGPVLALPNDAPISGVLLVPLLSFAGALAAGALVYRLASTAAHVSIPALLLIGIAVNTFVVGLMELIQLLMLDDWHVSQSILAWTFGTLKDRSGWHAATVWCGLLVSLAVIPFTAYELDLMQPGLEDAEALGVNTARVRRLALLAAAFSASAAVAVAGQIAFVGLVVPHLVRRIAGISHRRLLPFSALLGACFLLSADLLQRALLRDLLQPGVLMSLVGGPFFVFLLWSKRREIALW